MSYKRLVVRSLARNAWTVALSLIEIRGDPGRLSLACWRGPQGSEDSGRRLISMLAPDDVPEPAMID